LLATGASAVKGFGKTSGLLKNSFGKKVGAYLKWRNL
jgi:hypothetical protein